MDVIADILLVAGALGAGFYCYILARRLSRFNDLENGVGGAVAVLSAQVDDEINANRALAQRMQIAGTPTFVVKETLLRGYVPLEGMRQVVAQSRAN